jgi:hypothetical protein
LGFLLGEPTIKLFRSHVNKLIELPSGHCELKLSHDEQHLPYYGLCILDHDWPRSGWSLFPRKDCGPKSKGVQAQSLHSSLGWKIVDLSKLLSKYWMGHGEVGLTDIIILETIYTN